MHLTKEEKETYSRLWCKLVKAMDEGKFKAVVDHSENKVIQGFSITTKNDSLSKIKDIIDFLNKEYPDLTERCNENFCKVNFTYFKAVVSNNTEETLCNGCVAKFDKPLCNSLYACSEDTRKDKKNIVWKVDE